MAVTSYAGLAGELSDDRSERTSWYTLLFITALFYMIEHNFFASVHVPLYAELAEAAENASEVAGGSLIRRLGYLAFGLYGVVAWLRVPRFRLNARGFVAVMLLTYLAWAVLSLAWSESPMLTIRRLTVLILMSLGITGLLRQCSGNGIVRLVLFMTLSYLVIGVAAELVLGTFTPWSSGYRFTGTLPPNIQGINCAALVFSALASAANSRRFRPALLAVATGGFGFLVLTGSRGAITAGVVALLVIWLWKTRRSLALMTASVFGSVALLGTFLVVNGLVPSPLPFLLRERVEGAGVLSGRSDLWAVLIEYARQRPILGYGYGAFFDPQRGLDIAARVGTWTFGGPHSLYLGTLVDVGVVGLASLIVVLFGGILRSIRFYRHTLEAHYLLLAALLVFQIVDGITEGEMINPEWHLIPGLAVAFLALRSPGFRFG